MSEIVLYIGNKNYSSWSLRPWIAMRILDIEFREELVPFDMAAGNPAFADFSPTNKVPVLEHGTVRVWESLAIMEYLNDLFYTKRIWPHEHDRRAHARAISCEMLSGFSALRSACPMNMRREPAELAVSQAARDDVKRIVAIWKECLEQSGGPFLFGHFSAADAMFAPVVNRFDIYRLTADPTALSYMEHMKSLPAWQEWESAGRAESWVIEEDEV
ncbi:glutathione S-transferase family protein [Hoeflea prorocentri]|uniref:Glutathione S-transferase family protein n=1 Tax=Hoeflea prorocentri TaxID=1922333 RepID=A0A9X3ULN7_9HYPH|nr:glutathione S-transferase family protein [Hoeflea prorocentri]MCY6383522.1 glutathione S-transferase family protein [Hoeflea prorocentri]MDA5401322.1 glutathione S-transferase family protein [Hoeflea prorocentri]